MMIFLAVVLLVDTVLCFVLGVGGSDDADFVAFRDVLCERLNNESF
jgi:hypothetical protein